jgi:hypothetical protein
MKGILKLSDQDFRIKQYGLKQPNWDHNLRFSDLLTIHEIPATGNQRKIRRNQKKSRKELVRFPPPLFGYEACVSSDEED